jgi:heme o synthase
MSFAEPAIPTATPPASGRLAGSSWRSLLETNKATSRVASFATTSTVMKDAAKTTRKNTFSARLRSLLRDYKQLSKARLSALVVATAAAGYAAGSEERIDWKGMGWTSLGTMLTASSANALNQAYEIANDARMRRTATRPLPAGRMTRSHALVFALLTGGTGLWILAKHANGTTAALGAANLALYAGVYTPLKQLSVVNTWVGAVVGAVPPLMGWAAAAGGLDIGAFLLAAGLYFWQMPHFMALAWLCREDYAAGGYRMLSAIDPTGRRTAACALRNCAYLLPLGMAAAWLGVTTPYFAYESCESIESFGFNK